MSNHIHPLNDTYIWDMLSHIPQPPKELYIRGTVPPIGHRFITIVGSRRCSEYSKQVIDEMCASLAGQPVSIISGLAVGVDSCVHQSALTYNLHTIAIAGSGLQDTVLYPQSNRRLAQHILEAGGALISEQKPNTPSQTWMFPARNRIMVGLSSLIIIIEARQKSGTLITARLATDYNRDLLVVPNSIYSSYSKGSNELIKQGAYVYTEPKDIFELLKLDIPESPQLFSFIPNETEKLIIQTIAQGHDTTQKILDTCSSSLTTSEIIQILLSLEIEKVVKRIDGRYVVL